MNKRSGQSLVEVLVAVVIGVIIITAAVTLITPALQGNTKAMRVQAGSAVGKQLLDNVVVFANANWDNLTALATSSANKYYLNTSSSPFTAATGTENVTVGSTTFNRYFYIDDVYRDSASNGAISGSGIYYDPSTKKATVIYTWPAGATATMHTYLTRSKNSIFHQTNWYGGPGFNEPVTTGTSAFATSSNIDYTNTTGNSSGSIRVILPQ